MNPFKLLALVPVNLTDVVDLFARFPEAGHRLAKLLRLVDLHAMFCLCGTCVEAPEFWASIEDADEI